MFVCAPFSGRGLRAWQVVGEGVQDLVGESANQVNGLGLSFPGGDPSLMSFSRAMDGGVDAAEAQFVGKQDENRARLVHPDEPVGVVKWTWKRRRPGQPCPDLGEVCGWRSCRTPGARQVRGYGM